MNLDFSVKGLYSVIKVFRQFDFELIKMKIILSIGDLISWKAAQKEGLGLSWPEGETRNNG